MKDSEQFWYVVKQQDETCKVAAFDSPKKNPQQERWGSFTSEQEAIAKKIGLIRAGKCKPLAISDD